MLSYRAVLPLSCKTLNYAVGIICRHRKLIGPLTPRESRCREGLLFRLTAPTCLGGWAGNGQRSG
jgi:hypothetical protein